MSRRSSASIRLWLVAALFGLSALVPAGAAQDWNAVHPNQAGAFAASTDVIRSGVEPFAATHLRRISHPRLVHALPRTSASASLFQTACVVPPSFAHSLAVREHVTALTSASLSAGPSRGPPAA